MSSGTFSTGSLNVTSTEPFDGSNLIQWAVLFALAFQVPKLLEEIRLILDLHYHSFPLLVVLGSFPSLLKRNVKKPARTEKEASYSNIKGYSFSSAEMYRTESSLTLDSETFPETSTDSPDADDWGHFAELDETMMALERTPSLTVPSRRPTLSTLKEAEEEE